MARTKLKNVKLNEVSFVGKGDNKGAHILLVKNHPSKIVALGKEYKGKDKAALLKEWIEEETSKVDTLFKEEEVALFADLLSDKTIRDQVWSMVWMLEDSICNIMCDESGKDKGTLIATTVDQFKEAITSLTKNNPEGGEEDMKKTVEELEKELEVVTKERDDLKKANETLTGEKSALEKERDDLKKAQAPEDNIDKSALPENVRKHLEEQERINKENADAIALMKEEAITKDCESIAKEIPSISAEGVDVVKTLATLKKSHPDLFKSVHGLLKTADARIKEGGLFKEKGAGSDPNVGATAYDQLVAKAKALQGATPGLSFEKAFDKVYGQEHDLRKQYNSER